MIIIADNDIVHKLALCNLLDELLNCLQVPPNEIWVLPTLKFWIRRKLKNNSTALACFEQFLRKTADVPAAETAALKKFESLDVGEQQLLAVFITQPTANKLISGDKRALQQLAQLARQDQFLQQKLNNRVDCLEGILCALIQQFGFEYINDRISRDADGVFRLAFGANRTEQHAIAALQSYLQDLHRLAPFLMER